MGAFVEKDRLTIPGGGNGSSNESQATSNLAPSSKNED